MRPVDLILGSVVAVLWGLAFVATKIALGSFSPPQLVAMRFLIAAVPAVLVPCPSIGWSTLVPIGLTLFAGQFLLQFFGIANGMPPGLASIVVQTQAFFTVLFAACLLRERPSRRAATGMVVASTGLVVIALTVGRHLTLAGFVLTVGAAVSWAVGNILLKRTSGVDMLQLMVWLSLVPPLPSLALAMVVDGPMAVGLAIARASWLAMAAALYLGLLATVLAYAIWGHLLRRYSAAMVAPFALLVPCVGVLSSSVVFGERFGLPRLAGMALVLVGVAVIARPDRRALEQRP